MRRRDSIAGLAERGGVVVSITCTEVRTNAADRMAVDGQRSPASFARTFVQTMRERGYVEGDNLAIEYRWAAGDEDDWSNWLRT